MHYLPLSHLTNAVTPAQAGYLVLLRGLIRLRVAADLADHGAQPELTTRLIGAGIWDQLNYNLHTA